MNTRPSGIALKTAGMVMNRSDGPASGSKPKAKTAGKMAMPARMETSTSPSMTRAAVPGMFWSARK